VVPDEPGSAGDERSHAFKSVWPRSQRRAHSSNERSSQRRRP
jgi:hypothetical protein